MSVPLTATQSPSVPLSQPSLLFSLLPVLALVITVSGAVYLFGEDASGGPIQIALFIAAGVAMILAVKSGKKWKELEEAIAGGVSVAINALLILLMIGAVIGSWIVSGTVPALIYYGLKLIDPSAFYVTTCIVCSLGALSIGSSWSVIGTLGLGLFGVATSLGLSPEITAGAIISGAYFGDKMSPLSDTTNLSPAVAGTDLFTHIRHMTWTTVPAILIALIIYVFLGLGAEVDVTALGIDTKLKYLDDTYNIGLHLLLPLVVVVTLAIKKFPALPAMMISTLVAILVAVVFQQDILASFGATEGLGSFAVTVKALWIALYSGFVSSAPDAELQALLSRGGMLGILPTLWLVLIALMFGSIMEKAGFLQRLIGVLMTFAKSTGSMILTAVLTCIGVNIIAADQYISIVLPGRMFQMEFRNRKLAPENLSRVLEDAGTVTSPLVPWNTCGAFIYGVLGISAFAYAPYCFFNILCPIISATYGMLNYKIVPLNEEEEADNGNKQEPPVASAA